MFFLSQTSERVDTTPGAFAPPQFVFSHKKDMARKGRCRRLLEELEKDFERELEEKEKENERAETAVSNVLQDKTQGISYLN